MIDLRFWPTPNGWKITVMLEEAALPYRLVPADLGAGAMETVRRGAEIGKAEFAQRQRERRDGGAVQGASTPLTSP